MGTRFRKSDKWAARNLLFWLTALFLLPGCNPRFEVKYDYYDANKTIIRAKGEYIEGKLDGRLTLYNRQGRVVEVSHWKNGHRDGKRTAFGEAGNIKVEVDYRNDKLLRQKWFYPSGVTKREQIYDSTGIDLIGIVDFDSLGKPEEMYPYIWRSRLVKKGDSIETFVMLKNVVDINYLRGWLIVGRQTRNEDVLIEDTLVVVPSNSNLYRFKFSANDQRFIDSLGFQIFVCCPDHLDSATYFYGKYKFLGHPNLD